MNAVDTVVAAHGGERIDALPDAQRPQTEADAYAIQDGVLARLGPAAGWKVGAKGPDAPFLCAPLIASAFHTAPAELPGARFGERAIEAEIAFRIGRDLPARDTAYARDEVIDAIDAVMPAIEVVDGRFRTRTAVDRLSALADNLSSGAFIVGAPVGDWRSLALDALPVRLLVDGREAVSAVGGNPVGDPLALLARAVDTLSRRAAGLKAGMVVTTGSCTGVTQVDPRSEVSVAFSGLGRLDLRFI